jgi:hypothetical protein
LIYLILTLNHIYPDYDFSQLRAHHFRKEAGLARAEELVDTHLLEVSKVRGSSVGSAISGPNIVASACDIVACTSQLLVASGRHTPAGGVKSEWPQC